MSDSKVYPVPPDFAAKAHIDVAKYNDMYQHSINDPDGFWAEQAKEFVTWYKPWTKVTEWDFHRGHIRWFEGAKLNVSYNCLDRHLETRGDQALEAGAHREAGARAAEQSDNLAFFHAQIHAVEHQKFGAAGPRESLVHILHVEQRSVFHVPCLMSAGICVRRSGRAGARTHD